MKGSMLLSLIGLCVVMLFMESRISDFLHGDSGPAAEEDSFLPEMGFLADWGDALAGLWQDLGDFFVSGLESTDALDDEKVVITEDTIRQVWVWRENGAIQSSSEKPGGEQARQVLIPQNMTATEFFGASATDDNSGTAANQSRAEASTAQNDTDPGGTDTGTPLDQLSPEQRRAMLEQGMNVLQRSGESRRAGSSR